ncbi:hypothetical protein WR25_14253 [Diploscapter pachys]|uniref:C2H2-type domain-containing protein n=1 Tax=Diploscapter pachys TaxID=2018661 RepID=A0A2A2LI20_9BILA|nr:hypothetical protein WR25_14253 [Diploscapter pachys]
MISDSEKDDKNLEETPVDPTPSKDEKLAEVKAEKIDDIEPESRIAQSLESVPAAEMPKKRSKHEVSQEMDNTEPPFKQAKTMADIKAEESEPASHIDHAIVEIQMNGLPVGELIGDIDEIAHEFIEEVPSPARSNSESSYRPDSRDTQYTGSSIEVLPTSSHAAENAAADDDDDDDDRQAFLLNNVNFNYENLPLPNKFNCPKCGIVANSTEELEAHICSIHLEFRPWACSHCKSIRFTKEQIQKHVISQHNDRSTSVTYMCNTWKSQELRRLMETALVTAGRKDIRRRIEERGAAVRQVAPQSAKFVPVKVVKSTPNPKPQKKNTSNVTQKTPRTQNRMVGHRSMRYAPKCTLCNRWLPRYNNKDNANAMILDHVAVHMSKLFGQERFHCQLCNFSVTNLSSFQTHSKAVHKNRAGYDDHALQWSSDLLKSISNVCFSDENLVLDVIHELFPERIIFDQVGTIASQIQWQPIFGDETNL